MRGRWEGERKSGGKKGERAEEREGESWERRGEGEREGKGREKERDRRTRRARGVDRG